MKKCFSFVIVIIMVIMLVAMTTAKHFKDVFHRHSKKTKTQKDVYLQEVIVKTKNDSFKGLETETFSGTRYYSFLGIPFARPPIEELRFKPPKSHNSDGQCWDATFETSPCLQFRFDSKKRWNTRRLIFNSLAVGSENCLFLNVYTPQLPTYLDTTLVPVIVWVHGGGFIIGGAQQSRYGPDHFINEGLLMVSINYRLGAFGFLTTGDKRAPGNNGLRDQVMALKWIRNNIEYFGGDPKKVTLFGQSAGAASISYLIQSQQAKNLFNAAIMQSGTSLCPWALSRGLCPIEKYKKLRQMSPKKVLEYSMKEIVKKLSLQNPINGLSYGPVIERNDSDPLFCVKSHEKLKKCDIPNRVPILIGFNSREEDTLAKKMRFLQRISPFLFMTKIRFNHIIKDIVPIDLRLDERRCDRNLVSTSIREHYNISNEGDKVITPNLMRVS